MSAEARPRAGWPAAAATLGGAALLAVQVCLSLPAQILAGNRAEFYSPPRDLGLVLGALAAAVLLVLGLPARFLPGLPGRAYRAVLAALALAGWVMGSLLTPIGFQSALLDGKLDLSGDGQAAALQLVGLAAGAALGLGLALAWRHEAHTSHFCLLLSLLLFVTAGLQALAGPGGRGVSSQVVMHPEFHDPGRTADLSRLQAVSRSRAAVILLLDGFQGDFLDEVLERRPGLARSLAGFTFYRNTTGIAPTTALSLPMIHARRKASAGALLADLYASAVQQGSVLRALARQGWSVSLVNPIFKCPEDIETCAGQTAILRGRWGSTAQEASWLLDLALFRSAPLALKQKIYRGGSWFTRSLAVEPDALAGNHLLDEIGRRLEPVDRPTLHFLHLMGSHPPALVRADCVPEAREWTRATAVDQAECVLRGVTTFLDRLRAAGLYGTASIFVVADHGAGFSHRRASGAPDGDAAASLAGSANPLLLLKGPGDSGPLRLSDAPAELGDVPGSLCALDPGCGGAFGDGVEKVPASLQRERPFLAYQWNGNYWEADRGMQFQEFTIRGPVWDTASWKRVGSGSEVARSRLDFQQDDGEQAYGLGWGLFETSAGSSIRWVHGRSATLYLDLPEGRPLELYMVAGTIPANPHQTLALSVNGRPVGSIPVVGWLETRRLAIPAGVARQGTDELQLGFSEVMPPRPGDSRPLSVVFDQLEVR